MAKKKPKSKPAPKDKVAVLSQYCTSETVEVNRNELKGAPYNPRRPLTELERSKLRASLKAFGMVDIPVWNARTKNIVGGHQRIAVLDALEHGTNYLVRVSRIDVDEKTEKELNIALNNPKAQSDFDLEKLGELLKEVDFEKALFDRSDVARIFGEDIFQEQNPEEFAALAEQLHNSEKSYNKVAKGSDRAADGADFYSVLVFRSRKERDEFCHKMDLKPNKWLNGSYVSERASAKPQELT